VDEKSSANAVLKKRDNVVTAVIICISLILSQRVYRQQMVKYEKLKDGIKSEQEKSQSLERIVALNEKIKALKNRSWNTVDINIIIETVNSISLETQTKIRNIIPYEKKDEKSYVTIPLTISCEATYKDLHRFIKRLELNQMFFRVKSLSASPVGRASTGGRRLMLGVTLDLEAIYLK